MSVNPDGAPAPPEPKPEAVTEREARAALLAESRRQSPEPPPQRFLNVEDKRLDVPSKMLRRPGLLHRMFWGWVFRRVAFDERHQATLRRCYRDGDVVLTMHRHSRLDYLYFNYAFNRFGLPLVFFANQLSMKWFKPIWRVLAGIIFRPLTGNRTRLEETDLLAYGLERAKPSLVFLHRRGMWPWSREETSHAYLETILRAQQDRLKAAEGKQTGVARPIYMVPQLLVWSQNPNRYKRSLNDMVFGDPEAPGRLRKALNFLINRRRAFVQLGEPIDLRAFISEQSEITDLNELTRRLRFEMLQRMQREERVIKGPILKDSKRMRQEIMRTPEVQGEIRRIAEESGRSIESLQKQVERYLKEMAADFSMSYVEMMLLVLTVVFDRLYKEVVADLDGLERVREAGRKSPLVLLPCHRSHIDYLVISYLFYVNGLICPHIAAGQNLNFFPLGHIFRRCGAFFLRRSFKHNNPVYGFTFGEYVRKLMREGYWVEFFPEGGRSRTGKMLPPKVGILKMIIDAIRSGSAPDVQLVPIYVGYEQVIEEEAYGAELQGKEKKQENITGLLKTTRVLWSRYGRLYVSFAEPFSVKEALDRAGVTDLPADDPEYLAFVRRTAYRVLNGIHSVAPATPNALTALSLLMSTGRGIRKTTLLNRIGWLIGLINHHGAPMSKTIEHALKLRRADIAEATERRAESDVTSHPLALGEACPVAQARGVAVSEAVEEVLQRYVSDKLIEVYRLDNDDFLRPIDDHRITLEFYKNNIVHHVVREGILAAALTAHGHDQAPTETAVRETAAFLSLTFKHEFVYDPDVGFELQFERTLLLFEEAGLLERRMAPGIPGDISLWPTNDGRGRNVLELLNQALMPWIESYWLTAFYIDKHLQTEMSQKEFFKLIRSKVRKRFKAGDILFPEALSETSFKNALSAYTGMNLLTRRRKGRDILYQRTSSPEGIASLAALTAKLRSFISR